MSPDGRIFVSDRLNNVVDIYTADGTYLDKFSGPGNAHDQMKEALDVWVISNTELMVVDSIQDGIKKFSQK